MKFVLKNDGARLHHFDGQLLPGATREFTPEQVKEMRRALDFHLRIEHGKLVGRQKKELRLFLVTKAGQTELNSVAELDAALKLKE